MLFRSEAPEASILSKMSDLTLLLSAYGRTKKDEFALAYQKIENADGNNICVGLNNIPDRKIKKKFVIVKNVLKQRMSKFAKSVKRIFKNLKKLSKIGNIIKNIFKVIFGFVVIVLLQIRNLMVGIMNSIQKQVQKIKERIQAYQAKQEKIKLIEAGSMILEEENNIIKEVFESEIAKLESDEDVQYKKKLDELKMNLDVDVKCQRAFCIYQRKDRVSGADARAAGLRPLLCVGGCGTAGNGKSTGAGFLSGV